MKSRQACVAGGRCHFHVVCFQDKMTLSTTWGSAVRSHSVEYIHWWHPACRGDHVSVAHRLRWGPHLLHDESMRTVYQTALPSRQMESSTWGALHSIHRYTSRLRRLSQYKKEMRVTGLELRLFWLQPTNQPEWARTRARVPGDEGGPRAVHGRGHSKFVRTSIR